jgi:hypothetical protein
MKLAYFDCAAGIAGDMCLGALLDCGVPHEYLLQQLQGMGLAGEFELKFERVHRAGQPALHAVVEVLAPERYGEKARHWPQIREMIEQASLSAWVKEHSLKVFQRLAEAEARVHQQPMDRVHFHEVGAVDALVDIVGTCLGLEWLRVDQVLCSPHPIGGGWVQAAHGQMAVPVPAVIELWEMAQVPVFSNGMEAELVTPTGAALATALAQGFGPCPAMRVERVGHGAGTRDLPIPNVLRLWLGSSSGVDLTETVSVLETQIDDLNPQVIAYTFDRLLQAGALDVYTQSVTMKQGRPGTLMTVICYPDQLLTCQMILFEETTTLGIRCSQQHRVLLERRMESVQTRFGEIAVKVATRYGQVVNVQPEFRECVASAQQHQVAVQTVWLAAHQAWQEQRQGMNR